jgi:hypothetical protein
LVVQVVKDDADERTPAEVIATQAGFWLYTPG